MSEQAAAASELALTLDGGVISPEAFRQAATSFVDLLLAVSNDVAGGAHAPQWNISVRTGSDVFVATPLTDADTRELASEVLRRICHEAASVEHGDGEGTLLPLKARYALHELAGLADRKGGRGSLRVRLEQSMAEPVVLTRRTVETLDRALSRERRALGTVEGRILTITERATRQFVVYDDLHDVGVNCFAGEEHFHAAHAAFGRRVSVFGEIQYDREERPHALRVHELRVLRELHELPPLEAFRGILQSA